MTDEVWSSDRFKSGDIRQTDRQKAMHMSPPCMRTGVLKKGQNRGRLSLVLISKSAVKGLILT